jgi:spore coat protein JC
MWKYEKKLQYPVKIKNTNPQLAKIILTQYGGPDGELAASLRYLSQRFTMPNDVTKGILNDIGTEELAHLEMIGSIVYQLTRNMTPEDAKKSGFADYYVDHSNAVYPASAAGVPFTAAYIQSKGDPIADLTEDLAAEQKARATYDNILKLTDDPDVREPIKFLRQREVVHFQRFGEALRTVQDLQCEKNKFYMNYPNMCNPFMNKM